MSTPNLEPMNIDLLFASDKEIQGMLPIQAQDIFEASSKNFHPKGLFSTEIFGRVGSEHRNRLFSYIDLKVDIIHPFLFKHLMKLSSLYEDIITGKKYVTFNKSTGDFEESDIVNGFTGYDYFFKHIPLIKFEERESRSRQNNIRMWKKYKNNFSINRFLVIPAGLRDYTVDDAGQPSEDEINTLYRRVMGLAFSLEVFERGNNTSYLDPVRLNLQIAVQNVYEYLLNMLKGKKGLIQQHFASRRIMDSTRNVLVAYTPTIEKVGDPRSVDSNKAALGLYQFLRAFIPACVKEVREQFGINVFPTTAGTASLIDKKTLKKEFVVSTPETQDMWMSYDGLEKVFASYGDHSLRHMVLEQDGRYMALLYDDGKRVRLLFDIDEVPEGFDRTKVKPATLTEVLYLCVFQLAFESYGFVTRFPVASYGGIYPSGVHLRTTIQGRVCTLLDENWNESVTIPEFPIRDISFFDALTPSVAHLKALGADHDGDTGSFNGIWAEESREEVKKLLNSWTYYTKASGSMAFSFSDDIADLVLLSLTSKSN